MQNIFLDSGHAFHSHFRLYFLVLNWKTKGGILDARDIKNWYD